MIVKNGQIAYGIAAFQAGPTAITSYCRFINIEGYDTYLSGSTSLSNLYLNKICNTLTAWNVAPDSLNASGIYLWVGSNDNNSSVSINDYTLDTPFLVDNFIVSGLNLGYTPNGEPIISEIFTNNTASNLTIKEVGLFTKSTASYYTVEESGLKIFMLGREIISPTIVEPGKSVTISFKITYI